MILAVCTLNFAISLMLKGDLAVAVAGLLAGLIALCFFLVFFCIVFFVPAIIIASTRRKRVSKPLESGTKSVGTISEAFAISQRGVAVLFSVSPVHISHLASLNIVVSRPDGSSDAYLAFREFARTPDASGGEVVALFVRGTKVDDLPVGSVVDWVVA